LKRGEEGKTLCSKMNSLYLPELAVINSVVGLTENEKLLELRFQNRRIHDGFRFQPGQFMMISVFGVGEAPFSISSSPSRPGYLEFCIRNCGNVTGALHRMEVGDMVGLRGPFGNGFPFEEMRGKDVLVIAGGLGLAPLRSLIVNIHDERSDFGRLTILYGAKSSQELLFTNSLNYWQRREDIELLVTVDEPDEKWCGRVGLVTALLSEVEVEPDQTYAILCGPTVMYKFVVQELLDRLVPKGQIFVSFERRMNCGVGKCGHCGIGYKYTCIDGPVFNYWQVMNLQEAI